MRHGPLFEGDHRCHYPRIRPGRLISYSALLITRHVINPVQLIAPMLWIALAAAAQLSAPEPINLKKWFSFEDVPSYLMQMGTGIWNVGIRVNVASDGAVQNCEVESGSGIPKLDKLTCMIVTVRAKFRPAHFADGSPAHGAYRTSVNWLVQDAPGELIERSKPDLDITVRQLPRAFGKSSLVRVMFAVDANGNASSCTGEPGDNFEQAKNEPALVPLACEQFMNSYKPTVARDTAGNAVPSVQDGLVRFTVKGQ
ncbi:MAG TPA: energy transducer TonB [Sphingomicrobium sp.]|nr:energy transducer TonB [Sphingomicrobium sp.]